MYIDTRAYLTKHVIYLYINHFIDKDWATSFNNINQRPSPDDNLGNKVGVLLYRVYQIKYKTVTFIYLQNI